jgi:transformation/transcription domain-associated protein
VHGFQLHDSLLQYADLFLDLLLTFLQKESEKIGIMVMKILMDWHRFFKAALENKVPPFIEYVRSLYDSMQQTIQAHFIQKKKEKIDVDGDDENVPEIQASKSFRVLAEAPIDIVILFQIHRKWMTENIGLILPSVVKVYP